MTNLPTFELFLSKKLTATKNTKKKYTNYYKATSIKRHLAPICIFSHKITPEEIQRHFQILINDALLSRIHLELIIIN